MKKTLKTISEWEASLPDCVSIKSVRLKDRKVTSVVGTYGNVLILWDGFGIAYHFKSRKRCPSADINI